MKQVILMGSSVALLAFAHNVNSQAKEDLLWDDIPFTEGTGGGSNDPSDIEPCDGEECIAGTLSLSLVNLNPGGGNNVNFTLTIGCDTSHTNPIYCTYKLYNVNRAAPLVFAGATTFEACTTGGGTIVGTNINCRNNCGNNCVVMEIDCTDEFNSQTFSHDSTMFSASVDC